MNRSSENERLKRREIRRRGVLLNLEATSAQVTLAENPRMFTTECGIVVRPASWTPAV